MGQVHSYCSSKDICGQRVKNDKVLRFSRFFTETTQNFDRKYLWNYNSYGPVVWLIRSTISRGTKSRGTFISYFQPFWRYMKITAHASRAKNRVTYMSYRSQRVNIEV